MKPQAIVLSLITGLVICAAPAAGRDGNGQPGGTNRPAQSQLSKSAVNTPSRPMIPAWQQAANPTMPGIQTADNRGDFSGEGDKNQVKVRPNSQRPLIKIRDDRGKNLAQLRAEFENAQALKLKQDNARVMASIERVFQQNRQAQKLSNTLSPEQKQIKIREIEAEARKMANRRGRLNPQQRAEDDARARYLLQQYRALNE